MKRRRFPRDTGLPWSHSLKLETRRHAEPNRSPRRSRNDGAKQVRILDFSRCALCVSMAAAMLTGCGGSQPPISAPASSGYGTLAKPTVRSKTFVFTGNAESFTVPAGVQSITVVARGAAGGGCMNYGEKDSSGRGGRVYAVIPVTQHERLEVYVGGEGAKKRSDKGGFNGGSHGGGNGTSGGGGASDVRVAPGRLQDHILVAGGGGGQGEPWYPSKGYGYSGMRRRGRRPRRRPRLAGPVTVLRTC